MLIFSYICTKCKHEYEGFANEKCPLCSGIGEKIISAPNFIIKGSCTNPTNAHEAKTSAKSVRKRVLAD